MSTAPRKTSSLYICHWSLRDPLCQSQALGYLRKLTAFGHTFALMTFEQPPYAMGAEEAERARWSLAAIGIYWYPITYHRRSSLVARIYDCLCGIAIGLSVSRRHDPEIIHTRGTTPVGIAVPLQALTKMKFLYDADSSLAEEYADTGYWSRTSLAFRLADAYERVARKRAAAIIVLSEGMRRRFVDLHGVAVPVEVIPCCVDTDRFRFDPVARQQRRSDLTLGDEKLFVYVGKAGWRYQVDPMFEFLRAARARIGPVKMLVLTPDSSEHFTDAASRFNVAAADLHVTQAAPDDVAGWLSAADAGLAFIRTLPCETGSSPVKIAEYLSVGLPVVITPQIGDYSQLIETERLGVVVRSLDPIDLEGAADEVGRLIEDGQAVRQRCRSAARNRLSVDAVGVPRYVSMYDLLGCRRIPGPVHVPSRCEDLTTVG